MKPIHSLAAAAALSLTMAAAAPAQAQSLVTPDPIQIQSILQSNGYRAEISKDKSGDPMITSGVGGAKFLVLFYGCTNHVKCTTIQFYAGFEGTKMTVGDMNEWNKAHRFSRAYIDKDGDPCIEGDLDLDSGGMSRALFLDNLDTWGSLVGPNKAKVYRTRPMTNEPRGAIERDQAAAGAGIGGGDFGAVGRDPQPAPLGVPGQAERPSGVWRHVADAQGLVRAPCEDLAIDHAAQPDRLAVAGDARDQPVRRRYRKDRRRGGLRWCGERREQRRREHHLSAPASSLWSRVCRPSLAARNSLRSVILSPPRKSVTKPPASLISNRPAATSHGLRSDSQKPSKRPAATQARSRAAEPSRRMPATSGALAPKLRLPCAKSPCPRNGMPVAISASDRSRRAETRSRCSCTQAPRPFSAQKASSGSGW